MDLFRGRRVALALEGSRHFRPPGHLGYMPFEGAKIVVFQDDLGEAGPSWIGAIKKGATKIETIAGLEVVMRQEKWEDDMWSLYYAHARPNVLILATNRGYLQTVLERMAKRGNKRALPANLPEWKQLDATAKTWAIRHYDSNDTGKDMTLPFGGKSGANVPDENAVGFTFWVDHMNGAWAEFRYLSTNPRAGQLAAELFRVPIKYNATEWITGENPGVARNSVSLGMPKAEEILSYLKFCLDMALGHGVIL